MTIIIRKSINNPFAFEKDKSKQERLNDIFQIIKAYLEPRKGSELLRLPGSKITFRCGEKTRSQPIGFQLSFVRNKLEFQSEQLNSDKYHIVDSQLR